MWRLATAARRATHPATLAAASSSPAAAASTAAALPRLRSIQPLASPSSSPFLSRSSLCAQCLRHVSTHSRLGPMREWLRSALLQAQRQPRRLLRDHDGTTSPGTAPRAPPIRVAAAMGRRGQDEEEEDEWDDEEEDERAHVAAAQSQSPSAAAAAAAPIIPGAVPVSDSASSSTVPDASSSVGAESAAKAAPRPYRFQGWKGCRPTPQEHQPGWLARLRAEAAAAAQTHDSSAAAVDPSSVAPPLSQPFPDPDPEQLKLESSRQSEAVARLIRTLRDLGHKQSRLMIRGRRRTKQEKEDEKATRAALSELLRLVSDDPYAPDRQLTLEDYRNIFFRCWLQRGWGMAGPFWRVLREQHQLAWEEWERRQQGSQGEREDWTESIVAGADTLQHPPPPSLLHLPAQVASSMLRCVAAHKADGAQKAVQLLHEEIAPLTHRVPPGRSAPCVEPAPELYTVILRSLSLHDAGLEPLLDFFESIPAGHRNLWSFGHMIEMCLDGQMPQYATELWSVLLRTPAASAQLDEAAFVRFFDCLYVCAQAQVVDLSHEQEFIEGPKATEADAHLHLSRIAAWHRATVHYRRCIDLYWSAAMERGEGVMSPAVTSAAVRALEIVAGKPTQQLKMLHQAMDAEAKATAAKIARRAAAAAASSASSPSNAASPAPAATPDSSALDVVLGVESSQPASAASAPSPSSQPSRSSTPSSPSRRSSRSPPSSSSASSSESLPPPSECAEFVDADAFEHVLVALMRESLTHAPSVLALLRTFQARYDRARLELKQFVHSPANKQLGDKPEATIRARYLDLHNREQRWLVTDRHREMVQLMKDAWWRSPWGVNARDKSDEALLEALKSAKEGRRKVVPYFEYTVPVEQWMSRKNIERLFPPTIGDLFSSKRQQNASEQNKDEDEDEGEEALEEEELSWLEGNQTEERLAEEKKEQDHTVEAFVAATLFDAPPAAEPSDAPPAVEAPSAAEAPAAVDTQSSAVTVPDEPASVGPSAASSDPMLDESLAALIQPPQDSSATPSASSSPSPVYSATPPLHSRIFYNNLRVLAIAGDWSAARELAAQFSKTPPTRRGSPTPWSTSLYSIYLGCFVRAGEVAGAEEVWQQMLECGLRPDSSCFRNLIQTLYASQSAAHIAKVDSVLEQMRDARSVKGNPQPLLFSAFDLGFLLRSSMRYLVPSECMRWVEYARAAGIPLEQQLPGELFRNVQEAIEEAKSHGFESAAKPGSLDWIRQLVGAKPNVLRNKHDKKNSHGKKTNHHHSNNNHHNHNKSKVTMRERKKNQAAALERKMQEPHIRPAADTQAIPL